MYTIQNLNANSQSLTNLTDFYCKRNSLLLGFYTLRKMMQSEIVPGGVNYLRPEYIYSVRKKFAPAEVNHSQLKKNLLRTE